MPPPSPPQNARLRQTAHSLGRAADIWLDPGQKLRQEAVKALTVSTGYTPAMIETAIDAAFEELTEEKILPYCASEPGFTDNLFVPRSILHILAGNVFTAWLPGAVITLLLGADCALKPSSHEPVFAPLWRRSLQQADPALADKVKVIRWKDNLLQRYDAVVAYGSDQTVAALKAKMDPTVRFVGYGYKFSVAVIWKEALNPENLPTLLEQLQKDVEPFDLQGCLSPQIIYVEGDPRALDGLASNVRLMPRIKPFDSWQNLKKELASFRPHVSALGVAGPAARFTDMYADVKELGISRACELGSMQRPPLTWRNGGISLVDALTRR